MTVKLIQIKESICLERRKIFTDFVIRKYEGLDIYYSAPEYVDGVQKGEKERDQLLKEKFVKIQNHNIPNLEQYYAQAESHEWNKREALYHKRLQHQL